MTNNNDSRLASATDSQYGTGVNYYDHLGQRVMRISPSDARIYIYDLSGNMIGELDSGGNPINTYIYQGNQRLAMVAGYVQGSFCSIGQATRTARDNWAVMVIAPITILLIIRLRKRRKTALIVGLIGAGAITFLISRPAKSTLTYGENIYYYHNDHLGTPKVMTDADRVVATAVQNKPEIAVLDGLTL